jgi:hydroxymethylpyrimidine pyrophosphatase-like HAD family hydrolase
MRERLFTSWAPVLSVHCDLTKSNPEYLEFVAKGVSKGTALTLWLDRHGIKATELIAFGDAENDLEMLDLAGLGFAMSNATPGLRSAHGRFTRWSHAEDGVARELCDLYGIVYPG